MSAEGRAGGRASGKERSIVSNMRGTTRDAIDTDMQLPDGRKFKLIDTAGIRRRVAVAGAATPRLLATSRGPARS